MRFLRNLTILVGLIASGLGLAGWAGEWDAHAYTTALGLISLAAFIVGAASITGSGQRQTARVRKMEIQTGADKLLDKLREQGVGGEAAASRTERSGRVMRNAEIAALFFAAALLTTGAAVVSWQFE